MAGLASSVPGCFRRGMRLLGVDPGSRIVGWALLEARIEGAFSPKDFRVVEAGVIAPSGSDPLIARVCAIHDALYTLVQELRPEQAVMESAFFGVNAATALKLGQARGAMMCALSRHEVAIAEITPAMVKRVIAGNGRAGKDEVAAAVAALTGVDVKNVVADVTDAIAIALAYALTQAPGQMPSVKEMSARARVVGASGAVQEIK